MGNRELLLERREEIEGYRGKKEGEREENTRIIRIKGEIERKEKRESGRKREREGL